MHPSPDKRLVSDLIRKGEKIGNLLKLKKVATFNMAWKEPRLALENSGECYPIIDVLEKLAEMVSAPVVIEEKPAVKRGRKKKEPDVV